MVVLVFPLLVKLTMFVLFDPVLTVPNAIRGVTAPCAIAEFSADEMNTTVHRTIVRTRILIIMSFCLPFFFGVVGLSLNINEARKLPALQISNRVLNYVIAKLNKVAELVWLMKKACSPSGS